MPYKSQIIVHKAQAPVDIFQVNDALKLPYFASSDRLSSRRALEHYNIDSTRILKLIFSSRSVSVLLLRVQLVSINNRTRWMIHVRYYVILL